MKGIVVVTGRGVMWPKLSVIEEKPSFDVSTSCKASQTFVRILNCLRFGLSFLLKFLPRTDLQKCGIGFTKLFSSDPALRVLYNLQNIWDSI